MHLAAVGWRFIAAIGQPVAANNCRHAQAIVAEYVAAACGLGGAVHTVATPARNRIFVAGDEG
jgi:hypothetical protein